MAVYKTSLGALFSSALDPQPPLGGTTLDGEFMLTHPMVCEPL